MIGNEFVIGPGGTPKTSNSKFFKGNEYFQLGFFFLSFALAFVMLLGMPRMSIPLLIAYIMYLIISPIIPIIMAALTLTKRRKKQKASTI